MNYIKRFFNKFLLDVSHFERLKIILLAIGFFSVIGCYTILRELRDSIFINTVGREYIQYAQLLAMLSLIPALFLFQFLVDRLKKHQLLYFYAFFYGGGCLVIGYFMGHPTIGLPNTAVEYGRLFGWLQYVFVEGYQPFIISLFLSFVNSVTAPATLAQSYSVIVAGSKLGGMFSAAFALLFLSYGNWAELSMLQFLTIVSAILVLTVPLLIGLLIKKIPESYMHGYEASYLLDKQREKQDKKETGLFSGLTLMFKYPYAFGIFGLVFLWETINVVLSLQRLGYCAALHKTVSGLTSFLYLQTFYVHFLGFIISLLGSRVFLKYFGERRTLLFVPIATGLLVTGYFYSQTVSLLLAFYVLIRALNFSMAVSVREALYIPTTKDLRFKSKSWADAFGAKCARGSGSFFSLLVEMFGYATNAYYVFCMTLITLWFLIANALGKRFERAIKNNEVIG